MLLNRTVNKKILETIVHETFSNFGTIASSSLLDSLKLLGFYYATNAGISISIEDLKTPDLKKQFIKNANEETYLASEQWQQGLVSDTERFQSIIDSWNIATESLKNRIIDYYQKFDPANNLYIMAFSGARGNMSQVRQLVGMRGLMSDQEGKIIDLPIKANFREGLSSIDYIISSYGARKGIVDTALKTADSGYLTRRLIYIAQDLVIREVNCQTNSGVLILLNKKTNITNLIGRHLISYTLFQPPFNKIFQSNEILTIKKLNELKHLENLILNIRSTLTCNSNGSICQQCYGWDLATEKLIGLGEAVGIVAAQSIGEPGTQLTMRTFHTGGIFTSETLKQIVSPFSGKIEIPKQLEFVQYRTNHGKMVLKLTQEAELKITNWQGFSKTIFLDIGSFLYIDQSSFLKKGDLIAEYSTTSFLPGTRRLKPIYTFLSGEIKFENVILRQIPLKNKSSVKVNEDDGILWIASGKIFPVPIEAKYIFPKYLNKEKSFAFLKLVSPFSGVIEIFDDYLIIKNDNQKIYLNFHNLTKTIVNCRLKISLNVKNYQYIDQYTVLGLIEIYPNYEGEIYSVRKKNLKYLNSLFMITEDDIWKIYSDQVTDFSFFEKPKNFIRSGQLLNSTTQFNRSGIFLKKDGFKMIFQNANPIFLSRGTILNYNHGDFVLEKKVLGSLVNYTQQTEDIVQGLPKIDELIEARHPKTKAYLAERPGVFLKTPQILQFGNSKPNSKVPTVYSSIKDETLSCYQLKEFDSSQLVVDKKKPKKKKQIINVAQSIYLKDNLVIFRNQLFRYRNVPPSFEFVISKEKKKKEKHNIALLNNNNETLLINGKLRYSKWKLLEDKSTPTFSFEKRNSGKIDNNIYKIKNQEISIFKKLDKIITIGYNNRFDYVIDSNNEDLLIYLERINPLNEYNLPLGSQINFEPGQFIDIGEPITEGMIDIHELLEIFFKYHCVLDGLMKGTLRSLQKFQLLLVNSIQAIYQSQGVNISSKHIEIIVRQMTGKVVITESGDTPLLPGELVKLSLVNEIHKALRIEMTENQKASLRLPSFEPVILSATIVSLSKDGFLSPAGFQETKKILTRSALEGTSDWLQNLKECIIIGRLIPAGSSFLNYKNHLDNVYRFKT